MKSPRRRAREFALQAVYQLIVARPYVSDLLAEMLAHERFAGADAVLFEAIVRGSAERETALAESLQPFLDRPWAEVTPIEKSILLIGAFELTATLETPYRVILNEMIEIAKTFGGTDAHKYVNGILDRYAASVRADEVARPSQRRATRVTN